MLPAIKAQLLRFNHARLAASEAATNLEEIERQRTKENTMEIARPLRQAREELGEHAERMRVAVRAVLDLGVQIKHLDPALVDFPTFRDGRIVYLCWQEGEATIAYWHDVDSGFAGRESL